MKAYDEIFKKGLLNCKTCKEHKKITEFWKDKGRKRGYDSQCKETYKGKTLYELNQK